jgi:hypothetical protein
VEAAGRLWGLATGTAIGERGLMGTFGPGTVRVPTATIPAYQRRTKRADALIAGAYCAGIKPRRVPGHSRDSLPASLNNVTAYRVRLSDRLPGVWHDPARSRSGIMAGPAISGLAGDLHDASSADADRGQDPAVAGALAQSFVAGPALRDRARPDQPPRDRSRTRANGTGQHSNARR